MNKPINLSERIDEMLFGAFVGLYHTNENGEFVSITDDYGVLENDLRKDIEALCKDYARSVLPETKEWDEIKDNTDHDGWVYKRGFNSAIDQANNTIRGEE